eukprot:TRINITY_DN3445_c0_g1_i1.p1 TRINITY_DN3445_c0_g1~~TRINITY_DN3445_c0_g1_i1.p1  ORF type:complete len:208 (+),score=37.76 TRINITY_DN3445_c0_g1_i1:227-850(+)
MSLLLRSALLRASVQQRGAVLPMAQRTFSSAPQKQIGDAYYTAPSITQEKAAAEAQGGRYVNPFEDPYAGLHYQWRTQDVREEDEVYDEWSFDWPNEAFTPFQMLAMCGGALGVLFGGGIYWSYTYDHHSKRHAADRNFPYDNLFIELGGNPDNKADTLSMPPSKRQFFRRTEEEQAAADRKHKILIEAATPPVVQATMSENAVSEH